MEKMAMKVIQQGGERESDEMGAGKASLDKVVRKGCLKRDRSVET